MEWWQALIQLAVAGGAGSLLTTAVTSISQRRKTGADAASILTDTALKAAEKAIAEVEKQAASLRKELRETRAEMRALRGHMGTLETLLRSSGIPVPEFVWPPRNGVAG